MFIFTLAPFAAVVIIYVVALLLKCHQNTQTLNLYFRLRILNLSVVALYIIIRFFGD